ncbi:protein kinase domain-containing protein [Theileria equi strain WA]|uniref:Protein kinase domain-containing protein n=1 Tax=Theileria equi strain WA TaxID=1537102 RepID=L0AYF8_THEEQ|nr:protein kinase domain-containing protein [Theileria equi strain WA]AFZ80627.1 protein kinase domain-containing protein [Theileria equi strain WA]|eukprot:XP_004830293.1 protein kinase domain-containing protein [Theileria equi strain WA]
MGNKFAVKRTRKFGKKRSRELVNLGICNGAKNIVRYFGSFYTIDPFGNCMQNSLFEHYQYNLRCFIRTKKATLEKNKLVEDGHKEQIPGTRTKSENNAHNLNTEDHKNVIEIPDDSIFQEDIGNQPQTCPRKDTNSHISTTVRYTFKSNVTNVSNISDILIYVLRNVAIGINEMHSRGLVHRDLKPDNILIDNENNPKEVKICDFGSSKRIVRAGKYFDEPRNFSTPYICSRWYRAPELLLGSISYGSSVDNWSFGCICAELLLLKPFSDAHQLLTLMDILGTPNIRFIQNDSEDWDCSTLVYLENNVVETQVGTFIQSVSIRRGFKHYFR